MLCYSFDNGSVVSFFSIGQTCSIHRSLTLQLACPSKITLTTLNQPAALFLLRVRETLHFSFWPVRSSVWDKFVKTTHRFNSVSFINSIWFIQFGRWPCCVVLIEIGQTCSIHRRLTLWTCMSLKDYLYEGKPKKITFPIYWLSPKSSKQDFF